ncbi:hypothetical protein KY284_015179 [Solanum tuberosum]|nr:hypothetical protein KY284_015179 [Solanum tuberosum]
MENTINDNRKLSRDSSGRRRDKSARTIQNPSMNEGATTVKGTTSRSEVARRLSLNTPPTNAELQEESDLENFDDGKGVDSNGTVHYKKMVKVDAEKESIHIADIEGITGDQATGKEHIKEHKEPWTNMLRNNQAANNGMNLSYFTPQIVDGQTMAQLEENEVQVEEDKWKCALFAYVIGECPGYNTMSSDMNEILYVGPYTINNRPIILKQWCPEFDFGSEFLAEIPLWLELNTLAQGISQPWLIARDLIALLSPQDRLARALVTINEVREFAESVKDIGVTELQWKGNYYTWTNKQHGNDRISSRIDKVFGIDEWMDKWGHVIIEYESLGISDHCPMQLILQTTQHCVRVNFKFLNVWIEHESFMGLVESIWKQDSGKDSIKKVWSDGNFRFYTTNYRCPGLQSIGNDKAPDIDGYNAYFFKYTWKIIKKDTIDVVHSFFKTEKLYKLVNCTLVTLTPKAGFIPGRKISDNILLAHELVKAYIRKNISPRSMLNIDLQKAYDSVEWTYLEQVMNRLRFPVMFTQWVMSCVRTVNYSIVVNGQATHNFVAAKRLRQGDPMSSFLFLIHMEYLNNLLIFSIGDLNSIKAIQRCFSQFSQASGLQANLNKSFIYFRGVQLEVRQQIIQQFGYKMEELSFKYLGVPLSTKKLTVIQWYPFIEKIMARINSWTSRKLSYAGRTELVQTVLFGVKS